MRHFMFETKTILVQSVRHSFDTISIIDVVALICKWTLATKAIAHINSHFRISDVLTNWSHAAFKFSHQCFCIVCVTNSRLDTHFECCSRSPDYDCCYRFYEWFSVSFSLLLVFNAHTNARYRKQNTFITFSWMFCMRKFAHRLFQWQIFKKHLNSRHINTVRNERRKKNTVYINELAISITKS